MVFIRVLVQLVTSPLVIFWIYVFWSVLNQCMEPGGAGLCKHILERWKIRDDEVNQYEAQPQREEYPFPDV